MSAVAAGLDRLGDARQSADDGGKRQPGLALALLGPFMLAAAAWTVLPAAAGINAAVGFTCLSLLASLGALLLHMTMRRAGLTVAAAIAILAGQFVVLLWAAGGIASPATALLVALPVEAWLATRDRRAAAAGCAAAVASLAGSAWLAAVLPGGVPAAWQWLLPLAYPALIGMRRRLTLDGTTEKPATMAPHDGKPDFGALRLRFAVNGDLIDAGPNAVEMLGVAADFLAGSGLFERVHVADRVRFLCAFADMREGAPPCRIHLRLRLAAPGGRAEPQRFGDFALDLALAPGGTSVDGLLRDDSEAAGLRAALARAEETAASFEIAKGQFLATVSHELRTPLNSIIGFSEMLLCEVHGSIANERQKDNVATIREAGQHLLAVVNSILDVSRIESGCYATNPEPFAFVDAATLCCQMLEPQAAAKSVHLLSTAASGIGDVKADRRAVQQMLINLVSNAIKFTPHGGQVTVGAKRMGARLQFWVSDTGIGISQEDLGRIGQPFTQVQTDYTRQFEGLGLGLVLVKGLVSLHEGTMSIDSAVGAGTTVTISLPMDGPTDRARNEVAGRSGAATGFGVKAHGALRKAG